MTYGNGNPLLDAETTLVGWTNRSAIRNHEHTFLSGEEVLLNTKLDTASRFSLVVSHPGADSPVEVELLLAPVLRDGTTGSWISAATVALPAEGGRVEAFLSGRDLQLNAAGLAMWTCRRCVLPKQRSAPRPQRGCTWALPPPLRLDGHDSYAKCTALHYPCAPRPG